MRSAVCSMDAIELADFLHTQETGVLSMAADNDGYGVPLSFAYDENEAAIFFRLGYAPTSEKRRYLATTELASFVVYDETPDGWRSVVAKGTLTELSETSLDSSIIEAVNTLDIPFFQVHDRPSADLEFGIVALDISTIDGIVGG